MPPRNMKTITIGLIDRRLESARARSILLVCQKLEHYQEAWNEETRQMESLLKLRLRQDSFVARTPNLGSKVTPLRSTELTEEKIRADGPFDFVVIAGEVTYQSFSIAARVRSLLPETPVAIEFCETTYNQLAGKLILKNSRHHKVEDLLNELVYLTANTRPPQVLRLEE